MGIFGKLFGTDKALSDGMGILKKVTGGVVDGIDAAWYTTEEKSRDIIKVLLSLQDQFTPRSISRRILACMFTAVYLCLVLITALFACLGYSDIVNSIISIIKAFELGWIQLTIIIFYFGYYGAGKMMGKK